MLLDAAEREAFATKLEQQEELGSANDVTARMRQLLMLADGMFCLFWFVGWLVARRATAVLQHVWLGVDRK